MYNFPKGAQLPGNRAQMRTRMQTLQNPGHILSFLGLPLERYEKFPSSTGDTEIGVGVGSKSLPCFTTL